MAPPESLQIAILLKVQRLLLEGSFVASYKFALLQALLDIAVEAGDDSGAALPIPINLIAEKFIQYYWRQIVPYVPGRRATEPVQDVIVADAPAAYESTPRILRQITGSQSTVLEAVRTAHARFGGKIGAARADRREWGALVRVVASNVRTMPLWKLQTVSGSVDEFLYVRSGETRAPIELLPGVAFTLRRFHGFLEEIVRSAWVRFVRRLQHNRDVLGDTKDLHEFLFGSERASLEPYRPILRELQSGRCFYCDRPIAPRSDHVDHFIPWSRYGMDLAHNFVLADWSCNDSKSDLLASTDHLRRWTSRNAVHGDDLVSRFERGNLLHDLSASRAITQWAYALAAASASKVWHSRQNRAIALDDAWRGALDPSLSV